MDPSYLQDYFHQHIPISAAMGVEVTKAAEDGVNLRAPLQPNINRRRTVFGGSASAGRFEGDFVAIIPGPNET